MLTRIKVALRSPDAWKRLYYFVEAGILFAIPVRMRAWIFAGDQHYCPICGTHLRKFLVLNRLYHLYCPICRSLQRIRLLWLFIDRKHFIPPQQPQRMLHFAPEACLTRQFASFPALDYVSADIDNSKAMLKMDITRIEFPENSFDIILCSHVLEHVVDDHKALRELYRVLKPGGQVLILVPIIAGPTQEEPGLTDPVKREQLFGQFDHVRSYGSDFHQRMERAGLKTVIVSTDDLVAPAEIELMGLRQGEQIFIGKKE